MKYLLQPILQRTYDIFFYVFYVVVNLLLRYISE